MSISDYDDNYDEFREDEFREDEFSEDDIFSQEIFAPEIGAYDRVAGEIEHDIPKTKQEIINQDPLSKFKRQITAICIEIREYENPVINKIIPYSETLVHFAKYLDKINFKNPYAYILGYIASDGGKEITKINFNNALKVCESMNDDIGVSKPDIIRYARLWKNLYQKE